MSKRNGDTESDKWFCVKVKKYKKGFVKKIISKDLFKKKSDAERYYNGIEPNKNERVELSVYVNERETWLKEKCE